MALEDLERPGEDRDLVQETFSLLEGGPLHALMEHLPAIVTIELPDGAINDIYISPQVEQILGFTPEEWLSVPDFWLQRLHPDDREWATKLAEESAKAGERFHAEYRMLHRDGHVVWIAEDNLCIFDDEGRQMYWQGVMLDITGLKETEARLRITEDQYKALVEALPAVFYIDNAGMDRSLYVSPQIEPMLGVPAEGYLADVDWWQSHVHPDDLERAVEEYQRFLATGQPEVSEYRMVRDDGRVVWITDRAVILRDSEGAPTSVQGVMFDISADKEREEEIAYLAIHDRLTDLPNRTRFVELTSMALARARRSEGAVVVMTIDIDDFKLVNNSLGHAVGDELLRAFAERLQGCVTEADVVARQGGDEFLVLLGDILSTSPVPGPDMDTARITAETTVERLRQALETPFRIAETELYLTVSVGVALFPGLAADADALLKQADSAMFRSKRVGPGGHVLYSTETSDEAGRLSLSTRLRKAVEAQSWVLHYQPIVDLDSAAMKGVEALLRWNDPNGGLIPPGDFIPLAEEMGLIETIGRWVIEEVARQCGLWQRQGIDLEVGFNLSPRQLWQRDMTQHIFRSLEMAGADPSRIVMEITEGTAMTDPDRTQRILWDLHGRGLRISIDDFGTGYSSLARLKHLPVSTLKIDRAFVRDVPGDMDAGSMVDAVIRLAHGLGMSSLAEGIETREQWDFLREKGCSFGQGYFFSRPVPPEEITAIARGASLRMADDITN